MIQIQRVYDRSQQEGFRVLVDRLWPRGVRKEALALDAWCPEIAPSGELRRWFSHRHERWPYFQLLYRFELFFHELGKEEEAGYWLRKLRDLACEKTLVLLYAAADDSKNNAVVLRDWLLRPPPDLSGILDEIIGQSSLQSVSLYRMLEQEPALLASSGVLEVSEEQLEAVRWACGQKKALIVPAEIFQDESDLGCMAEIGSELVQPSPSGNLAIHALLDHPGRPDPLLLQFFEIWADLLDRCIR